MMRILVLFACVIAFTQGNSIGSRIIGGYDARNGQFPYQVSIRQSGKHICGGSIFSPTKILTAAHCIKGINIQTLTIVAGSIRLDTDNLESAISKGVIHQDYDEQTGFNDIAVLTLSFALSYSNDIQPIRLATADPIDGYHLIFSGWGWFLYPGNPNNILQFIYLTTIDWEKCSTNPENVSISKSQICAIPAKNQALCKGDSGGPLVNKRGEQVGIAPKSLPCATGRPDVFTSVFAFKSWILSQ